MESIGVYCGIDPGLSGGIAVISAEDVVQVFEMPETEGDLAELFETRIAPSRISFCLIEKVGAFPGQGRSGIFTFGRGTGLLVGLLLAHHISHQEIRPQDWQRALGIPPRRTLPKKPKPGKYYPAEEPKREFKRRLRAKAQALFPGILIDLKTADALLIAEVARRIRG